MENKEIKELDKEIKIAIDFVFEILEKKYPKSEVEKEVKKLRRYEDYKIYYKKEYHIHNTYNILCNIL